MSYNKVFQGPSWDLWALEAGSHEPGEMRLSSAVEWVQMMGKMTSWENTGLEAGQEVYTVRETAWVGLTDKLCKQWWLKRLSFLSCTSNPEAFRKICLVEQHCAWVLWGIKVTVASVTGVRRETENSSQPAGAKQEMITSLEALEWEVGGYAQEVRSQAQGTHIRTPPSQSSGQTLFRRDLPFLKKPRRMGRVTRFTCWRKLWVQK